MSDGEYIKVLPKCLKRRMSAELEAEWYKWLDDHFDPGHYNYWKQRDQSVLPYINGLPQWVTEMWMPQHLVKKLLKEEERRIKWKIMIGFAIT